MKLLKINTVSGIPKAMDGKISAPSESYIWIRVMIKYIGMIVARNGMARPSRNKVRLKGSSRLSPRTMAYEAKKINSTSGITAPTVTMTELKK
jgi:hypothetical protein